MRLVEHFETLFVSRDAGTRVWETEGGSNKEQRIVENLESVAKQQIYFS
jgi:hypothetical protein